MPAVREAEALPLALPLSEQDKVKNGAAAAQAAADQARVRLAADQKACDVAARHEKQAQKAALLKAQVASNARARVLKTQARVYAQEATLRARAAAAQGTARAHAEGCKNVGVAAESARWARKLCNPAGRRTWAFPHAAPPFSCSDKHPGSVS